MTQNGETVTANPISLIFPRSSSAEALVAVLKDTQQFFSKWPAPPEIFVPFLPPKKLFSSKGLQLLNNAGLGYGAAVREGLKRASGEFSFVLDLPMEYPFADVFQAWMEFESHPETAAVIGSRRLPQSQLMRHPHRLFWKMDTWINRRLHDFSGSEFQDLTTSFYAFRNDMVRPFMEDVRENGYSFSPRLVRRAQRARLKVSEKPAHWNPSRPAWGRFALDNWDLFKMGFK